MLIRELADYDYDRAVRILDWPIREGMLAYVAKLRRVALEQWRWSRMEWAALKLVKPGKTGKLVDPPKMPRILRDAPGVSNDDT